jgi:fructose-1,6-bisphosphatase/inositol monophosphatase family enzyme
MKLPIDRVTSIIEEIAAQEVTPRFRSLSASEIVEKSEGELVTVADLACEKALTSRLSEILPGSCVVGEEAVAEDPDIMLRFGAEDPVWVIDPIDGTGNFARGEPIFAVMVGLVIDGRTVAGWIHDPVSHRSAVAEVGAGAFMDGERLAVLNGRVLSDMRGSLHASNFAPRALAERVRARRERVNAIKSLRCAGWEYLRLITGEMDFSLFTRLMPWDHVPGTLLYREAGGIADCFDGKPYEARRYRDIGVLMAPDQGSWTSLYETIIAD